MSQRLLTVWSITFQTKYKRKPKTFSPQNINGKDLFILFYEWASSLDYVVTTDVKQRKWVKIAEVKKIAKRVIMLDLDVGSYGEPGKLIESDSGSSIADIGSEHVPTGQNRILLFVPEVGEHAYLLGEESTRGSAGKRILNLFNSYCTETLDKVKMESKALTEDEVWQEAAELKEIEVQVAGRSSDIADGLHVEVGKVSYIAKPRIRQSFKKSILKYLGMKDATSKIVGVEDLPDEHNVFVTMTNEGRRKKFKLGETNGPPIRQVLNEADEPFLDNKQLLDVCADRVSDLSSRFAEEWDSSWSSYRDSQEE